MISSSNVSAALCYRSCPVATGGAATDSSLQHTLRKTSPQEPAKQEYLIRRQAAADSDNPCLHKSPHVESSTLGIIERVYSGAAACCVQATCAQRPVHGQNCCLSTTKWTQYDKYVVQNQTPTTKILLWRLKSEPNGVVIMFEANLNQLTCPPQ